jgi:hypothetical protein
MFDDFCGVRVVPIGKLFEKNTAGRQVGSGQCSTANVCYWVNSGSSIRVLPVLTPADLVR